MTSVDGGVATDAGAPMACMAEQKVLVATQTNLIADKAGAAATMAPNLVNAWGLAFNPSGVA